MTMTQAIKFRVKELLALNNISMHRLEQVGGISPNTMNGIIAEKNKSVNIKIVMQIIRAFGMRACEFFDSPVFDNPELEID